MQQMKLFLVCFSAFVSFATEESIQQKISKVEKKMKMNPNFGLNSRTAGSYSVRLNIPFGTHHYYGTQNDQAIAREAVVMIVQEYFKSWKLVQDGKLKSPATLNDLKLQYNISFSAATPSIDAQISKFENNIKKYEKNPNLGLTSSRGGYVVQPTIPPPTTHWYGIQFHQGNAHQAILMLAKEYLKSLELVRDNKAKFPATAQDLQLKYNEMVSKWEPQIMISKFKITLKQIEKNPNFGVTFRPCRYTVQLSVPPGARHWYGSHREHATARRAVLMIAHNYMKSLELVRDKKLQFPATASDLQLKYRTMFGELEEKSHSAENKLDIASEEKLLMNHERPKQAKYAPLRPMQQTLLKSTDYDKTVEKNAFDEADKNFIKRTCKDRKYDEDDKFIHKMYKVSRIWENWEEHEPKNFHMMGLFKIMDGSEAFIASAIKKVDGGLRGYCEEHHAWVNLEWIDTCVGTNFENGKVKENFKRKREQQESSIWQNGGGWFDYYGGDNDL